MVPSPCNGNQRVHEICWIEARTKRFAQIAPYRHLYRPKNGAGERRGVEPIS
jgi:hypothetical protein